MKVGDNIKHIKTNRNATVIDITWLYMRGQPMEVAKVQWDNGKYANINNRHFKNWVILGEEE